MVKCGVKLHPFSCIQCAVVKFFDFVGRSYSRLIRNMKMCKKKPSVKVYRKSVALAVKMNVTRSENTSSAFVKHQTLQGQ